MIDSVAFYRGWGPLTALAETWPELKIINCSEVNWSTLRQGQIVYVQRPSTDSYLKIIKMAKLNGKKVWVDFDDDLLNVPQSNSRNIHFLKDETKEIIKTALSLSDLVTVSTQALLESFAQYAGRIEILPNGYDKRLYPYRAKKLPPRKKIIFWRGSETHDDDLMQATADLINASSLHPEYEWAFIGFPFWHTIQEFKRKGIKHHVVPVMDPVFYFKFIYEMRPSIQVVPLSDNPFNRAKSNIAWIEGTHAGAIVVAPDFPEWQKPGVVPYGYGATLYEQLKRAFAIGDDGSLGRSENYIEENLLLDKINLKRKELIQSLLCE